MAAGRGTGGVTGVAGENGPVSPAEAEIESLSHDGRGVARLGGKVVFVHGALPGERVRFLVGRRRRDFDEAELVGIDRVSASRVRPRCPYYAKCGGCSLQHLDPARQVALKQEALLRDLSRATGGGPERVLDPVAGPVWGYRHKARLGVREVPAKGRLLVGFRERRSSRVTDMSHCGVLHPEVGERLGELSEMLGSLDLRRRIPQVEVAVGEHAAALVLRVLDTPTEEDLARLSSFGRRTGLQLYLQPGGNDSVQALEPDYAPLTYAPGSGDVEIRFRPTDFTQVNPAVNRRMVARVIELLQPRGADVLDLFCGLGNFSLPLARLARSVTGIEGDPLLVRRARDNARDNRIDNAVFYRGDLYDGALVRSAPWLQRSYSRVVLDPPRSGAREILGAIAASEATRLVYVSCHPGSLARDAAILVAEHGFRLQAAGVLDMFPHTAHIESIACFTRG